ncbi:hypothetical protein HMPREF3207_01649 [Citrobacter koseri]|nr:hypothetical protein HMPREF3207_01649 [Citrobacter koseri]
MCEHCRMAMLARLIRPTDRIPVGRISVAPSGDVLCFLHAHP